MDDARIAVIAIHGVGDHQPFEMAKGVADMLEDLKDGPSSRGTALSAKQPCE